MKIQEPIRLTYGGLPITALIERYGVCEFTIERLWVDSRRVVPGTAQDDAEVGELTDLLYAFSESARRDIERIIRDQLAAYASGVAVS